MAESSLEILFEKFEVIECLKKDDHASVYLANHIYLGKKIILKALNTEAISDNTKIERFKREAKTMAKLDHPNIIKVLDFGMYKEFFYISFEYFESRNLRFFINDKSITPEEKKSLVVQLLQGLAYAHQNQIIHRDIKPENILVNRDFQLKIGDFGLALTLNDNFVTSQYAIVGTPCYMSPEQVQGKKLSFQSDLFSAGIVMLELFTGINPFLGQDVNKTISNVINYNEEWLNKYEEKLPDEMKHLIFKLLRKDISKRIESAEAALSVLDVPLVKHGKESVPLFIRNRKLQIGSFVAVLLAVLLFLFVNGQNGSKEGIKLPLIEEDVTGSKTDIAVNNKNEGNKESSLSQITETGNSNTLTSESSPQKLEKEAENNSFNKSSAQNQTSSKDDNEVVEFGNLLVECSPWAHIYVEDKEIDTTPLSSPINLQTGTYNIKLVHPNYPEYAQSAQIQADKTTKIKVNLDELFGYLSCKVFPWGNVYVDNKFIGQTPFPEPVKIAPGSHKLTIKNPNFSDYNSAIKITKEKTLFINVNLSKLSKKDQNSNQ